MDLKNFIIKNNILCFGTLETMNLLVYAKKDGVFQSNLNENENNKINFAKKISSKAPTSLALVDTIDDIKVFIGKDKELNIISLYRNIKEQSIKMSSKILSIKSNGSCAYVLTEDKELSKFDSSLKKDSISKSATSFEIIDNTTLAIGTNNRITIKDQNIHIRDFTPNIMVKISDRELLTIGIKDSTTNYAFVDLLENEISNLSMIKPTTDNKYVIRIDGILKCEYLIQQSYLVPKNNNSSIPTAQKFNFSLTNGFTESGKEKIALPTKPKTKTDLYQNFLNLRSLPMPNPTSYTMFREKTMTYIASLSYITEFEKIQEEIQKDLNETVVKKSDIDSLIEKDIDTIVSKVKQAKPKEIVPETKPKEEIEKPKRLSFDFSKHKKRPQKAMTTTEPQIEQRPAWHATFE
ncbi:hypothetical protein TVAG_322710 [Trichomonas vaginalis G3]|uniref:Uncharacterized protein n=1 Tax=Trichomonas vaginalis (strain ATCC PRA-98 / G3) TaxID=412133 RepID=A2EL23_TRIV3|nr:hypothetical protein TVAGG3_0234320 [Trichomonas vaginalis G3]EAY06651.1 hypothetical protein TVAG_322710 [Trichomonas vaginalis G3]KAI5552872.1 hypothetical protein TVAGG3_0234320 [Trichomonas vaginalis G3]|eukprot:XP_001318874.1 hypothetical protein [Trichomonas vaginalis G3]